jgi:superfamily II DNA/RNA helicase
VDFRPLEASKNIVNKYKRYLLTTFKIKDQDYHRQFEEQLNKPNEIAKGPYLDVTDAFLKEKTIDELIKEGILSPEFYKLDSEKFPVYKRPLFKHQINSIKKALAGKNIVVSTGTGSGKTESFMIPILNSIMREKEKGTLGPGVRAILIYPMNALANDQVYRFRELLKNYSHITFGCYTGETEEYEKEAIEKYKILNNNENPLKNELLSRERMRNAPPNILITNYAMLEYLMLRPGDKIFFSSEYSHLWKFIVLDEAHVYRGATGIEVSMLLRRVKAYINRDDIQFILTSATLGDEKSNDEVAYFATQLCSSEFKTEDIVRGIKARIEFPNNIYRINFNVYNKLAQMLRDNEPEVEIKRYLASNIKGVNIESNLEEVLYEMILRDLNYHQIRQVLNNTTLTVSDVSKKIGISQEDLVDFVAVASKAIKNGDRIFEARYHMFIKALEGAYITLSPSKKLFITRRENYYEGKDKFKVFEIGVCNYCNSIYIPGKISDEGKLEQKSFEDVNDTEEFFLLSNKAYNDNDDMSNEDAQIEVNDYYLCGKCGSIGRIASTSGKPCDCGDKYINTVKRVKPKKGTLHKCVACESINTKRSVIRSFFTGHEAATSVVATALYEELPSIKVKRNIDKIEDEFGFGLDSGLNSTSYETQRKQFLSFSDSRQAAAYFASYLDQTYQMMLYKRIICEVVKENEERLKAKGIALSNFVKKLEAMFDKYGVGNSSEREIEAWKAVLLELFDIRSKTSLQNMGIVAFETNISLSENPKLGLKKTEVEALFNILADNFRINSAIYYDHSIGITEKDREYFTYNGIEMNFSLSEKVDYTRSWIPTTQGMTNTRADYIKRALGHKIGDSEEQINKFLITIWEILKDRGILKNVENGKYKLDYNAIVVRIPAKWYICPKCKAITMHNVQGTCPIFKCEGKLEEFNPDEILKNNHYREIYLNMDIVPLKVVEHTAQLDRKKAYEYQNSFKNKDINVLSCSTTFEMGVDVGTLETVFMRNMPPSPANYAQRAGRAGRSIKSAAYAITFCNRTSHDFSYFNEPVAMIKGLIKPPKFNIENEKIVIRHIYASSFAFFWRKYSDYFKDAGTFFAKDGAEKFSQYLQNKPNDLKNYILKFVPSRLLTDFDIEHFGWIDGLIGKNGLLWLVSKEFLSDLAELNNLMDKIKKKWDTETPTSKEFNAARKITNLIDTLKGEPILSFLSRKNLIPKYGFPVDTVELQMNRSTKSEQIGLNLSRDLIIAISEYAPDSQIVADNKLITGRYIKKIEGKEWDLYDYVRCKNCNTLNITRHNYGVEDNRFEKCAQCGIPFENNEIKTFLIPNFGFIMDQKVEKVRLTKPERTYRGEISYIGYENKVDFIEHYINGRKILIGTSSNDELAVLNESKFFICDVCGYGLVKEDHYSGKLGNIKHKNPSGYPCLNNILKRFSLGHRFKTDVVQIKFISTDLSDFEKSLSILYGILEGMSRYLDIERKDISGCLHWFKNEESGNGNFSLILFDTTPGGAGHVKRITEHGALEGVFRETLRLMLGCKCGGDDMDTSCYGCLRNYYNQKWHERLKRRYVVDFLKEFDL